MRTEFIKTKVRPIKKLFVIRPDDMPAFQKITSELSDEVDGIYNLILQNDFDLLTEETRDFVNRYDPDIILNLSSTKNEILSHHFEVKTVTPNTDQWKIGRFGTPLFGFSNFPVVAQRWGLKIPNEVFAGRSHKNDPKAIFDNVNFGLVENISDLHLENSIFQGLSIIQPPSLDEIKTVIFDNDRKFCHLTTKIGFGSHGSKSIYEKDYNEQNFFSEGKHIFVSKYTDLKTICYFWNTRAFHINSNIAWIPHELMEYIHAIIDEKTTFFVFDAHIATEIKSLFQDRKIVRPERYYFSGAPIRWQSFEHTQIVTITGDSVTIQHPATKSFSDLGISGPCVIEAQGVNECYYPVRESFWELYRPDHIDKNVFAERFYRISKYGLSHYFVHFSLDHHDIEIKVKLPKFPEVVDHLFSAQGLSVKRTSKTAILEQLINLSSGLRGSSKLCEQKIFNLIRSLTPTLRTKKALQDILGKDLATPTIEEKVLEIISRARAEGALEFPETVMPIDELATKVSIPPKEKQSFFDSIQNLYNDRILLRGKYFSCRHCSSKVWIPLEQLRRTNYCPECGNEARIPIHHSGQAEKDFFKLNSLVVRALDQGQMATLLAINFFHLQGYSIFDFISNLEIFEETKIITDADLFIRIGNKIGVAECKSASGFETSQIDSLISIATRLKCDFVVLSAILPRTSELIKESVNYIALKNVLFPVFILTEECLFSSTPVRIYKYFETTMSQNFQRGPILV